MSEQNEYNPWLSDRAQVCHADFAQVNFPAFTTEDSKLEGNVTE